MTLMRILTGVGASLMLVAVCSAQAETIKSKPIKTIRPVVSSIVRVGQFNPLIDENLDRPVESPDEGHRVLPLGKPNALLSGTPFERGRVDTATGTKFPAISFTNGEPPDCELAVGPTRILVAVNSALSIFDKRGRKTFQQNFKNFFASVSPVTPIFDPKVIYDVQGGRFVLVCLAQKDPKGAVGEKISSVLVAVSDSSNPEGTWKISKYDSKQTINSVNYWLDYPGLSLSTNQIAISGNMFPFDGETGDVFATVLSLDRGSIDAGNPTASVFNQTGAFTIQLAKPSGNSGTTVFGAETVSTTSVRLYAITKSSGTPELSQTSIPIPSWPRFASKMSSVGRSDLDPSDTRMETAVFRSGSLFATHPRGVSTGDSRVGCRWYEFQLNSWPTAGNPTLKQTGDILPPGGEFYSYPAINVNGSGNVAVCFSRMSPAVVADVMASGRRATDPLGRISTPTILESSLASRYISAFDSSALSVYRWGDYFDVEVDPSDDKLFWVIGMGAGTDGRWQTFVRSFNVQEPVNGFLINNATSVTIGPGSVSAGDISGLFSIDRAVLSVRSEPVRGSGQAAGIAATFRCTSPASAIQTCRIQVSVAGPSGATGFLFLKNQSTGAFEAIDSFALNESGGLRIKDLTGTQAAKYLSGGGEITALVRGLLPLKSGQMPGNFTFGADLFQILVKESSF